MCEFLSSWQALFFSFKIWIRIAVVYSASPKCRHQRMWLAAMNPLAVHTEHSWLLGRKNRSTAILSLEQSPCRPVQPHRANKVDFLKVTTPSFPQRALRLQNGFFPFCYSRTALRKRKLQALVAPQSLSTSDWNTSCNTVTLRDIIFHRGMGWGMLQHPTELMNIFQSIWTGFLLSTLKKKKLQFFFKRTIWMWNDQASKKN